MNGKWQEFLRSKDLPGHSSADQPALTSLGAPPEDAVLSLFDLSHHCLVTAHGEDAMSFLQGQLTCDLRRVTNTQSVLGAYLSPKGRVICTFRVVRAGEEYLIRLPASAAAHMVERLRRFVLRSRVEIETHSESIVVFGVAGADADNKLRAVAGMAPSAVDEAVSGKGAVIVQVPGAFPRYEVIAPTEVAIGLWSELAGAERGRDAWDLLEIRAGLPCIGKENSDAFVPQMVNLELVGGVSFTKGCYAGQEVVARTQYLGRAKRRMYRVKATVKSAPTIGERIVAESATEHSEVGRLVNWAHSPDGGFELLAVIQTAAISDGLTLRLGDDPEAVLRITDLPYTE
jgi:folate-binding protein YgfZ